MPTTSKTPRTPEQLMQIRKMLEKLSKLPLEVRRELVRQNLAQRQRAKTQTPTEGEKS